VNHRSSIESTLVHEVSHAVALSILNVPPERITIRDTGNGGSEGWASSPDYEALNDEDKLVVLWAGIAGEQEIFGEVVFWDNDPRDGSDRDLIMELALKVGAIGLDRAEQRAMRMVHQHRREILALAFAFSRHPFHGGTAILEGPELRALLPTRAWARTP
jgi:hypothetical protein